MSRMKCPICGSKDWVYMDNPPDTTIRKLDGDRAAIEIDFPCYCPDCDTDFYRRDVFIHSGEKTKWVLGAKVNEWGE